MDPTTDDADPFDALLSLEDTYYAEGHALGLADGARAGRIEGRVFGLEKGFEKFAALGALHARSAVWAARLPPSTLPTDDAASASGDAAATAAPGTTRLPPLSANPRLARHVATLHALTEPASLSTQNEEEAVSEFDDRWKRAQAKAKIVEKLVGEGQGVEKLEGAGGGKDAVAGSNGGGGGAKGPKRIGGGGVKMVKREGRGEEKNMEDFGAIKGLQA